MCRKHSTSSPFLSIKFKNHQHQCESLREASYIKANLTSIILQLLNPSLRIPAVSRNNFSPWFPIALNQVSLLLQVLLIRILTFILIFLAYIYLHFLHVLAINLKINKMKSNTVNLYCINFLSLVLLTFFNFLLHLLFDMGFVFIFFS